MAAQVKVALISTENIKPSSPTPGPLKTHKLSFLDQLHPSIFSHVALYYLVDNNSSGELNTVNVLLMNQLKESMSKNLSLFYPLAGRINEDQLSIDCNDEGLYFSESRVNCRLSDFLADPDLDLLNHFYPCHPTKIEPFAKTHPAMIQVNVFDCGGMVIGMCLSHKILDGISTSAFLKGWSACARGCSESIMSPTFEAASLFPPTDRMPMDSISVLGSRMFKMGSCVTRRFLFDASSIGALKSQVSTGGSGCVQHPSRVEVVSALIWKCAMSASEAKTGSPRKPSILSHAVDLRRRMVPPLGESSVGNLLWIPYTKCKPEDDAKLPALVRNLRDTIKDIDGGFVAKLQSGEGLSMTCENVKEMGEMCSKGPVDYYGFTSWSKFGMYETDFGWGKPTWVGSHRIMGPVFMNLVHMCETREGNGIEAWVTLEESEMSVLVGDEEFLTFATVDPSPL